MTCIARFSWLLIDQPKRVHSRSGAIRRDQMKVWLSDVLEVYSLMEIKATTNFMCTLSHSMNITSCQYISNYCDTNYYFAAKSYYCSNDYPSVWISLSYTLMLIASIGILMLLLGLIVSNYLLFCVTNFTNLFGIGEKVFSFFVVPLTNSLPDLFSYQSAMESESVDLVLGQVIGANLITFTIIIGLIGIVSPFSVRGNITIYVGFLWAMGMITILAFVLSDSKVTLIECVIVFALFVMYAWNIYFLGVQELRTAPLVNSEDPTKSPLMSETTSLLASLSNDQDNLILDTRDDTSMHRSCVEHFLNGIDHFIFLLIPVSKLTLHRLNGNEQWAKVALFDSRIFHFWMVLVSLVLLNCNTIRADTLWVCGAATLSYLALELTKAFSNEYSSNVLLDLASIVNSLGIISVVTRATILLLKNLGAIWDISEYSMGLLVFSLVNSLNDIAMNVLLSTNLGPTLGVNSCLGTCLISILLGIGLNGVLRILTCNLIHQTRTKALEFDISPEIYVSTAALLAVILMYILYLPWNDWNLDRRAGVAGIFVWITTTLACLYMDVRAGN